MKQIVWRQYGATLDMLRNAIKACPEHLWDDANQFWYWTYHTLFMTDYYMHPEPQKFHPRAPFTMSEMDPTGKMPERVYSKTEMIEYLVDCKNKGRERILGLTGETAFAPVITYNKDYPAMEIIIYNLRHIQHHTAKLNMLLREHGIEPPLWVSRAIEDAEVRGRK